MLGLLSQELSGARASELGLVGVCVDDTETEDRALSIAERVAGDPLLARRVKRSFQLETQGEQLAWPAALELERGVQLWTQHRRLQKGGADT